MRTLLISLLLLTVPGGLSAEEARGFFLHLGSGLLASFDQSSGRAPTLEIGLWKPLAAGNSHTTGIHLVHGFAEAKVGPNNLIAPGPPPLRPARYGIPARAGPSGPAWDALEGLAAQAVGHHHRLAVHSPASSVIIGLGPEAVATTTGLPVLIIGLPGGG